MSGNEGDGGWREREGEGRSKRAIRTEMMIIMMMAMMMIMVDWFSGWKLECILCTTKLSQKLTPTVRVASCS